MMAMGSTQQSATLLQANQESSSIPNSITTYVSGQYRRLVFIFISV